MHACSVGSDSATPWAVDLVAPLFMEFSRQEFWSGLPFSTSGNLPNPGIKPVFPVFLHWPEDSLPLSHQEALRILIGSLLMPLTLQGDLTVSKRHRSRGLFVPIVLDPVLSMRGTHIGQSPSLTLGSSETC